MLFYYLSSVFVLLCAFCITKKFKYGNKRTMGGWVSYMWWGGDPDVADPISGLTKRDIYIVQKTWAPVYANCMITGTELLRRYFAAYPETKDFFKMVRKLPEEEYTKNLQFKAHVVNLMTALNMAITNLHQPELVIAMMHKLGDMHGKRKIKDQHFQDLKTVIIKLFIDLQQMDAVTLASWGKTVDFWYKHIFTCLDEKESR